MKKVVLALSMVLLATTASAQWHNRGGHHGGGYRGGNNTSTVIGAALVAGLVGYGLSRPRVDVVEQPVIVQNQPWPNQGYQPYYYQPQIPTCTPWTEFQNADGSITRTRTCDR